MQYFFSFIQFWNPFSDWTLLSAGSVCSHKKVGHKLTTSWHYKIESLSDCKAFCEGNGAFSLVYRHSPRGGLVLGEYSCACCEESFHLTSCAGCSVHTLGTNYCHASFLYFLCFILLYKYTCNIEIFKLIKIYLEPTCATYGGIKNGNACCAASCGTCGGSDCSTRPGGLSNCCTDGIPSQQVCGPEQDAPCFLKKSKGMLSKSNRTIYKIFNDNHMWALS